MRALANTLLDTNRKAGMDVDEEDDEYEYENEAEIRQARVNALTEIDRHQRMDQWEHTYHNVVSSAALKVCVSLLTSNAPS